MHVMEGLQKAQEALCFRCARRQQAISNSTGWAYIHPGASRSPWRAVQFPAQTAVLGGVHSRMQRGRGRGRGGGGRGGGNTPSVRVQGVDAETEAESNVVRVLTEAPPLYPGISNLPMPLPVSAYDRRLIGKASMLRRRALSSAYYIRPAHRPSGAKQIDGYLEMSAEDVRPAAYVGSQFFPPELAGTFKRRRETGSGLQALENAFRQAGAVDDEGNASDASGSALEEQEGEPAEDEFDNDDYTAAYYFDEAEDDGGAFREDEEPGGYL